MLTKLPNGLELDARTEGEARLLYHEMFEMQAYLRHGIDVADGATVFDVGANIGGFSASLAQQRDGLRLVLFEPIPETFAMLRNNADRLMQGAEVTLVPKAVSSFVGTVTFETHPRWSSRPVPTPTRPRRSCARPAAPSPARGSARACRTPGGRSWCPSERRG